MSENPVNKHVDPWQGRRLDSWATLFLAMVAILLSACIVRVIQLKLHPDERLAAGEHFKMGFDGCGNTHGCSGAIFASRLSGQARAVRRRVEALLAAGRRLRRERCRRHG